MKINLITLPYAGGNKYAYNTLKPFLHNSIAVVPVELPGRGQRMAQPLLEDIHRMADDLLLQVSGHTDKDYILYGHSMGGILGNLLLHRLKEAGMRLPLHFFVTGCASPKSNHLRTIRHRLPDNGLKEELRILGGLPEEVLSNDDLMEFFLPIIRVDMKALELYQYQPLGRYEVPLTVICGTEEPISDEMAAGWADESVYPPNILRMNGNHFFILHHFEKLAELINKETKGAVYL